MTTPENIQTLKPNQVFVFGSNLNGNHTGGAALQAKQFGAIDGVGEGLTGQVYAFPTLDTKMKKVSKKALIDSKNRLYACASEHPDKQFLVTKVGCGIADFTEKVLKEVFSGPKPNNVILPAGWSVIRGYKAFNEGLTCRGMQYEVGKDFYHEGEIELCQSGLHFCKSLGDVYEYYNFGSIVAEIESEGTVIDEDGGNKSVTNHIRIIRVLGSQEAKGNKNDSSTGYLNTGDRNTGDRNTGNWNTGDRNTGNWNTGNRNTGNWNTGDRNTGNWNTGDRNTGFFNTKTPDEVLVFNKKCYRSKWENADKPSWLYFNLTEWIEHSEMTDEEKKVHPEYKTTGGYLKKYTYKDAFKKSYDNASPEERAKVKKLPNFDKKVFYEISGIMID